MFLRAQHFFLRDAHSVFTEIVLNKSSAASKRQAQCVAIRPTNPPIVCIGHRPVVRPLENQVKSRHHGSKSRVLKANCRIHK